MSLPLEHDWGDQALDLGGLELLLLALHNISSLAKERTIDNFMGIDLLFWLKYLGFYKNLQKTGVADPGTGAFLTPGSWMVKKAGYESLEKIEKLFVLRNLNADLNSVFFLTRDGKIPIRDKHPGSATLTKTVKLCPKRTV